jgi:hypothetical protein
VAANNNKGWIEEAVMNHRYMILPAGKCEDIVLLAIPEDFGEEEAFRFVTGLIAQVEEESPDSYSRDDIVDALEDHGFQRIDYELGPELDL